MEKYLKIKKTKSSLLRKSVGSDELTDKIFDACKQARLSVVTIDQELAEHIYEYDVYENTIPFCIASFMFATIEGFATEDEFRRSYLERIKKTCPR